MVIFGVLSSCLAIFAHHGSASAEGVSGDVHKGGGHRDSCLVWVLESMDTCSLDAHAEMMSLGPPGTAFSDTASGVIPWVNHYTPQLRVIVSTCERNQWLVIEEVVIGRADTRTVVSSYRMRLLDLFSCSTSSILVEGVPQTERISIRWLDPKTFIYKGLWKHELVVEQLQANEFMVRYAEYE